MEERHAASRREWKRRQAAMDANMIANAKRQCQSPMPNAAAPVPERTGCRCCERVVVKSPFRRELEAHLDVLESSKTVLFTLYRFRNPYQSFKNHHTPP